MFDTKNPTFNGKSVWWWADPEYLISGGSW